MARFVEYISSEVNKLCWLDDDFKTLVVIITNIKEKIEKILLKAKWNPTPIL